LFKAAQIMHVPPWELAKQSLYWQNYALAYWSVENEIKAQSPQM